MKSDRPHVHPPHDRIGLKELAETIRVPDHEEGYQVRDLLELMQGRGYPFVLVILALPFSTPIPLPLSPFFGIVLALLGLRMALAHKLWVPRWLLDKPMRRSAVLKLREWLLKFGNWLDHLFHPRWEWLCSGPLWRFHGVMVAVLALLLAIPIFIPFSNFLTAFPIVLLGLALLQRDGLFVVVAYAFGLLGVGYFALIYLLGAAGVQKLLHWF